MRERGPVACRLPRRRRATRGFARPHPAGACRRGREAGKSASQVRFFAAISPFPRKSSRGGPAPRGGDSIRRPPAGPDRGTCECPRRGAHCDLGHLREAPAVQRSMRQTPHRWPPAAERQGDGRDFCGRCRIDDMSASRPWMASFSFLHMGARASRRPTGALPCEHSLVCVGASMRPTKAAGRVTGGCPAI